MYLRVNNVAIPSAALTLASKKYNPFHANI